MEDKYLLHKLLYIDFINYLFLLYQPNGTWVGLHLKWEPNSFSQNYCTIIYYT